MNAMAEELGMKFFLRDAAKCPAGRMCRYNRYARAGAGIELRSLWLSYLCRAYGGCAMCLEYG